MNADRHGVKPSKRTIRRWISYGNEYMPNSNHNKRGWLKLRRCCCPCRNHPNTVGHLRVNVGEALRKIVRQLQQGLTIMEVPSLQVVSSLMAPHSPPNESIGVECAASNATASGITPGTAHVGPKNRWRRSS